MRAADARPLVGKRVLVRKRDGIVVGPKGTIRLTKVGRSDLTLTRDGGFPTVLPLRAVESMTPFAHQL